MKHRLTARLLAAIALLSAVLTAQESAHQFSGVSELAAFSKSAHASMLGYFPNANVVFLVRYGAQVPLPLSSKLADVKGCCNHRATPALSHHGERVAFVHVLTGQPRREALAIYDVPSGKTTDVFEAAAIWSAAWSPDDSQLAAVADAELPLGRSLYRIAANSGQLAERIHAVLDIKGVEYQVSNYSTPSWAPDGKRMAIELRRRGVGAGNSSSVEIGLLDLDSKAVTELTPGVEPAWSPVRDEVAYYARDRRRCFAIKSNTGEKRLLFTVGRRGAGTGSGPLFYPVVWSPDGNQLLFHQWVDPDLITDLYRVDLTSGKAKKLGRVEIQAVSWRTPD
jgi:Tol biopolymer transport system component